MSINYERVLLLLEVIERTSQHGPGFNELRGQATQELSKMMEDFKKNAGKVVTPPDGPANSAVANADGSYTRIPAIQRVPGESDEAWEARQSAWNARRINPQGAPDTPLPRSNERGPNETDAQFKARIEAAEKERAEQYKAEVNKPEGSVDQLGRRI